MWKKLLVILMSVLIVMTPAWASIKLGPDKLEIDGEVLGEAVTEQEMEGSRGKFLGVYFSVTFQGSWDSLGNYNATLLTNGNTGSNGTTASNYLPPNTAVKIEASVGGLDGAKGIFQITQVPGSGNIVTSTLLINIQIIQVLGNTFQNLQGILWK